MSQLQDPRIAAQYQAITREYVAPVQAAGLNANVIEGCKRDSANPDEYQRLLVNQLQATLPRNTPASISGRLSPQATADMIATTGQRVRDAVMREASAGPTLRAMVTTDATGREITEFVGAKKVWMAQYQAPALLMKRIGETKY